MKSPVKIDITGCTAFITQSVCELEMKTKEECGIFGRTAYDEKFGKGLRKLSGKN